MENPALHVDIIPADPANPAAPALVTPGSALLRQRLADAIKIRRAADASAADAIDIAARADALLSAARDECARIQAAQQEAELATTERRASAISEALRRGAEPPAPPLPAPADAAPLAAAMATARAIEAAAHKLAAERDSAMGAAARAAAAVNGLVDEIVFGEAPPLAVEAVAAIELHWQIIDRLQGLIALDETRHGGPRLRGFEELLVQQIDRRKAAVARDPAMIEKHVFNEYIDGLAADQKLAWQDYRRRLADDAAARFDAPEELPC